MLPRHRAVVGLDEFLPGEPVQLGGEPFCERPAVHEQQRRAMGEDEFEEPGVHRRPDRAAGGLGRAVRAGGRGGGGGAWGRLLRPGHVRDGHDDLDVEGLLPGGVDDGDRPRRPRRRARLAPSEEPGDVGERALGRGETDALRWRVGEVGESLQRQAEVGAALGAGDGVDLVDDDPLHRPQHLLGL